MLAGHLTNQDEDEVEDELAVLQREAQKDVELPTPPTQIPSVPDAVEANQAAEQPTKAKAKERTAITA